MSDVTEIYYGNDMVLDLADLTSETTGLNVNSASVTVTLVDAAGANVVGDSWPKAMIYVTGSNGIYRTSLLDTLSLTIGARYKAKISANAGTNLQGFWEKDLICRVRK